MATNVQPDTAKWWQRPVSPRRHNRPKALAKDRRSAVTVELAIVLPVFLTFLFLLFEVAYDQFLQGVLESAVQITAYKVQTGRTTNTASGQAFIDNDLCPSAIAGMLSCNNLYVRVQQFNSNACQDFYDATSGDLPVSGRQLELSDFVGESAGTGGNLGPTNCENTYSGAGGVGFCNAGPKEYILMTAIYLAPTFLDALIPGQSYSYNNHLVRAILSTTAFFTENFPIAGGNTNPC